jgi:hypothetical protein
VSPRPRRAVGPSHLLEVVDPIDMNISPEMRAVMYETRVQKVAQDQQRKEGEKAVELIEAASPGPDGQGANVDTYA